MAIFRPYYYWRNGGRSIALILFFDSSDGKELFFLAAKVRTVMVANVSYTPTFTTSVPVPAFTGSIQHTAATTGRPDSFYWDVTADGQKVLLPMVATQEHPPQPPIIVVLNWTALLKK